MSFCRPSSMGRWQCSQFSRWGLSQWLGGALSSWPLPLQPAGTQQNWDSDPSHTADDQGRGKSTSAAKKHPRCPCGESKWPTQGLGPLFHTRVYSRVPAAAGRGVSRSGSGDQSHAESSPAIPAQQPGVGAPPQVQRPPPHGPVPPLSAVTPCAWPASYMLSLPHPGSSTLPLPLLPTALLRQTRSLLPDRLHSGAPLRARKPPRLLHLCQHRPLTLWCDTSPPHAGRPDCRP